MEKKIDRKILYWRFLYCTKEHNKKSKDILKTYLVI